MDNMARRRFFQPRRLFLWGCLAGAMLVAGEAPLRAAEPSPAAPPVAVVVRLPEPLLRQLIRRQVDR
jgi:hypothetical protein